MATKAQELNGGRLSKIPEWEQIFILRAQDEMAPITVLKWIQDNFFTAPEEKLREAFETALAMNKQEDVLRKKAD